MKRLSFIWFAGLLCLCTTMVSCVGTAPMKEVRLIDSLNQVAYAYRYKKPGFILPCGIKGLP